MQQQKGEMVILQSNSYNMWKHMVKIQAKQVIYGDR